MTFRFHREHGAVAPIVAISLLALVAVTALAVDLGDGFREKRSLVTDVDAAAIAGARYMAQLSPGVHGAQCLLAGDPSTVASSGVYAEAEALVGLNDPDADLVSVTVNCDANGRFGTVEVAATKDALTAFSPVLGVDEVRPVSLATALYGLPRTVDGLRPFAVCLDDPHIQEWQLALAQAQVLGVDPQAVPSYAARKGAGDVQEPRPLIDYPTGPGPNEWLATSPTGAYMTSGVGVVHRVYFNQNSHSNCGATSGNWGQLCFVGNCGDPEVREYIKNGYPGAVDLGNLPGDPKDCDPPNAQEHCDPKTGNFPNSSDAGALDSLVTSGEVVPILVYSGVTGPGSNAEYVPAAFLGVRLVGYRATGAQANRYLDFEFSTLEVTGQVGAGAGEDLGVRVWQLCSADRDPREAADICQ